MTVQPPWHSLAGAESGILGLCTRACCKQLPLPHIDTMESYTSLMGGHAPTGRAVRVEKYVGRLARGGHAERILTLGEQSSSLPLSRLAEENNLLLDPQLLDLVGKQDAIYPNIQRRSGTLSTVLHGLLAQNNCRARHTYSAHLFHSEPRLAARLHSTLAKNEQLVEQIRTSRSISDARLGRCLFQRYPIIQNKIITGTAKYASTNNASPVSCKVNTAAREEAH